MKKIGYALALFALLSLAAGCGVNPSASPEGNGHIGTVSDGGNGGHNGAGVAKPTPTSNKMTIQAYYTDDDIMELHPFVREIEVSPEHSKYEGAFKALQSEDGGVTALWKNVDLNSITFVAENGGLSMNISLPDEARLGAGGEALALEALKNTMFQFDEVKHIELTVDGRQVESLMGHVDLEHPITRPQ
ncbi:GerMN domain-containing protein [Paenibacillus sp.]|uniref:GerMN domain-containing protein n=1 Tax=Paenibacillus sp. TaxID=58172 RepID=UPI00281146BD|nr:GerMN domain-containing protein [Paenibacillus sp.]